MRKKIFASWMFLFVLFFAVASGGCGGGGGGSDDSGNGGNTPNPPQQIDLLDYSGTWEAIPGSGNATATGYGGPYSLRMAEGEAAIAFSNVTSSSATARISSYVEWDAYSGSEYVSTVYNGYDDETVQVTRPAANRVHYTFPGGDTIDITIDSETTITVAESGSFVIEGYAFQYTGSYRMRKTN
jgi:hypothetical protein